MRKVDLIVLLSFILSGLVSLALFFTSHVILQFILELEIIAVFAVIYVLRCTE